ncbi:hypothetical protein [Micromonospora sp. NPDC048843]|uniref:hypothetical protein n=1 Tax=Micromonospora sp. NPDC048843 TaxID=3155389 RepID=UPI0033F862D6
MIAPRRVVVNSSGAMTRSSSAGYGRGTYADVRRHQDGPDKSSGPATRQRQVATDRELAALFAVEVGTTLIEQEKIVWTNGVVGEVVRIYRLLG